MTEAAPIAGADAPAAAGSSVRCFASLALDPASRRALARWGQLLADSTGDLIRPVHPDALHVTFAFLGDVPEEMVPEVGLALGRAAASVPGPIACSTSTALLLGPTAGVIAAGVTIDLLATLAPLRDEFVAEARRSGALHVDDRPWYPHVSVGRAAERGTSLEEILDVDALDVPRVTWITTGLQLVASIAGPGGAEHHHRSLRTMPFAGTASSTGAG